MTGVHKITVVPMLQRRHSVPDALRQILTNLARRKQLTPSVKKCIPTRGVRNDRCPQDHHRAHAPRGHAALDALRPILIVQHVKSAWV
ncbi:hypothetical protein IV03_20130 [Pseudomonas congelans]|nr:hypothetical protein IV03_20130 [Pseudomonas congelans]